jgi:hypothetical protein
MPSQYSQNLRLEKIASGEQANTWGNTTNTNLATLVEQAITGVIEVDVTSGNKVLTALDGAYDQARSMVLVITGTSGASRTVTSPSNVSKVYIVDNLSDGDVTIQTAAVGSIGVVVPTITSKFVYTDGTDFFEANNAADIFTADTVTITGTPTASTDAATVGSVAALLGTYLPKSGGTMTGAINMGTTNKITNLAAPTSNADAATKLYVDSQVVGGGIPAGTRMLFVQESAPDGWTKLITQNDKALRLVSGSTGGVAGGSVAFSSAFTSQPVTGSISLSGLSTSISGSVSPATLNESQIAAHSHSIPYTVMVTNSANVAWVQGANMQGIGIGTSGAGGGGSHTHGWSGSGTVSGSASFSGNPINLAVQYVDIIQCEKD